MLAALALGGLTQLYISSTYKRWSRVGSANGLTGAQVAETILNRNGIGAQVASTVGVSGAGGSSSPFGRVCPASVRVSRAADGGALSDHYDPRNNTVTLSGEVYDEASIAASAVAAHEVGHALQHAQGYAWSRIRTTMVPAVNLASSLSWILIFAGLLIGFTGLFQVGIAFFAITVLFQVVTLPVEINASSRGLKQLREARLLNDGEMGAARQVLTAAALTYVASALISVMYLMYYLGLGGRRRN
ncbi:MAG: zinc metallopeptidase [Actinomycetes bacterium]|nr:zinc metallopeptidase [Actinomycetes bacterium]